MKRILLFTLLISTLQACSDQDNSIQTLQNQALIQYADIVLATYEDSYETANQLKQTIDAFVANPTEAGFEACKSAWLAARIPYGQTEAFRFYGGPIDDADGPEGLMNAWPMDEGFIDYVQGDPNAGLINRPDLYPNITQEVLMDLNEFISEASIFTGYHAIEFLLWGQDFSTNGPGSRAYTDYVVGGTAANAARRGQYLQVVTNLLLENLASVRDEWVLDGAYRHQFLTHTNPEEALGFVFTALGELSKGELAGERMFVAIDTKDQENEHSCFSDNTIMDIKMNFLGIKNVYFGEYQRVDGSLKSGYSFKELAEFLAKTKNEAVLAAFEEAETSINAIPGPFDQTIVNDPNSVVPAIEALRRLSDRLADVGVAIGADF